MEFLSDIEIADRTRTEPIEKIAARAKIPEEKLEFYGTKKAKVDLSFLDGKEEKKRGKLILVTAITPTPAGEGKTTMSIGLADGLRAIGREAVLALREPSLGPVFGIKGGATGGGYAQIVPMADINLHFTGDFHAIGAANNLAAAMLDNHIHQGNALGIDPRRVVLHRCVDMNDRQLRFLVDGLGGTANGVPREDSFDITVATEVMAVLCLSESFTDLKERLSRMILAYTYDGRPVTVGDLKAAGAMCALLRDALKPNLVQTLEGTPAFVHGGPFANIAHGCNSVLATRMALHAGEYVVTEAGFGADLGAEKFFDIKCRGTGLVPDAVVLVATVRALKMHGGVDKNALSEENTDAVRAGLPNLARHVKNIKEVYGLPVVVAINRRPTDTDAEIACVRELCAALGVGAEVSTAYAQGGKGSEALARAVVRLCEEGKGDFRFAYPTDAPLKEKIAALVTRVYGGEGVTYLPSAEKQIAAIEAAGYATLPVCMAKTQYSFSDDPKKLCAPEHFTVSVKNVRVAAGAGFVVVLTGDIMTMPGLPKVPAAEGIDVLPDGRIVGLF